MTKNNQGADREPHAITRLTHARIQDLCQKIHAATGGDPPAAGSRRLGPHRSIRLVLASLRHNLGQESLAEPFAISQPTVSGVLFAQTPPIAAAPAENASTADDLEPGTRLIIDGTPIPCWAWHDKPELHSGEHHTTGVNLQVACSPTGHPAWPPTRCPAAPTTRGPSPNPASSTAAMTLRAMIRPDVLSHPAHRRQGISRTGT